ncbi:acetamidase/formamidase family protein [Lentilactobacillus sp. Marseille-Q4993]|uniref:acetamidase/formamidase family protein n=1 Tax=Lentilactobacillus sp. Marseille-Q4993 TaxID=3039492 RepID=UPI0024BC8271|nr:acetamidase/formamidase family protein [Lentilactobacillus sp. Marseille-Q4993]
MTVLKSNDDTVRVGYMDSTAPAATTINSGEVLTYVDMWTHWANRTSYEMDANERSQIRKEYPNGPYSLVGPVEIKGAKPGDVLAMKILNLDLIDWGWNSFPPQEGAIPDYFDKPYIHYFKFAEGNQVADFVKGIRYQLKPLVGVIATEPSGTDKISGILVGDYGGNLNSNYLTTGATVYLPVAKEGGRVWLGDIHAKQGNGVVDQTAIETAAKRLDVLYTLRHHSGVRFPVIETETELVLFGTGDTLDEAIEIATKRVVQMLGEASDLTEEEAYSFTSVAVDFNIGQYSRQLATNYNTKPPKVMQAVIAKQSLGNQIREAVLEFIRGKDDGEL